MFILQEDKVLLVCMLCERARLREKPLVLICTQPRSVRTKMQTSTRLDQVRHKLNTKKILSIFNNLQKMIDMRGLVQIFDCEWLPVANFTCHDALVTQIDI